jgi:hypothetical protein
MKFSELAEWTAGDDSELNAPTNTTNEIRLGQGTFAIRKDSPHYVQSYVRPLKAESRLNKSSTKRFDVDVVALTFHAFDSEPGYPPPPKYDMFSDVAPELEVERDDYVTQYHLAYPPSDVYIGWVSKEREPELDGWIEMLNGEIRKRLLAI